VAIYQIVLHYSTVKQRDIAPAIVTASLWIRSAVLALTCSRCCRLRWKVQFLCHTF